MRKFKIILVLVSALTAVSVSGQLVNSLYYMDNLPQASKLNPARMPNCNFYINLVNVNAKLFTDFGPELVLKQENVVNDTLRMPYYNEQMWNKFLGDLHDPMSLMVETEAGIGFGFRKKRGYYHFDLSERNVLGINLAKDLLTLNNLGEGVRKDFSTLSLDATAFAQIGIGYAREINSNLNIGFKVKLLKGLANAHAVINKGELFTSTEYWSYSANAEASLAFPLRIEQDADGKISDLNDSILSEIDLDYIRKYSSPSRNFGAAIDLGVEYKLLPNVYLSASLIDFGKIWWNHETTNITAKGDITFDGIRDADKPVFYDDDQEVEDFFTDFGDSLINLISTSVNHNNYSTGLAPKLYIGAEYLLTDAISFGILSNTTFYRKKTMESIMFSANANLFHFLTAGAHYGWNWSYANTGGFTLGVNLFPIQIYVAADYLPLRYHKGDVGETVNLGIVKRDYAPIPVDFNALSFQVGMNLKFGCRKRYNVPIYNNKYDEEVPGLRKL